MLNERKLQLTDKKCVDCGCPNDRGASSVRCEYCQYEHHRANVRNRLRTDPDFKARYYARLERWKGSDRGKAYMSSERLKKQRYAAHKRWLNRSPENRQKLLEGIKRYSQSAKGKAARKRYRSKYLARKAEEFRTLQEQSVGSVHAPEAKIATL